MSDRQKHLIYDNKKKDLQAIVDLVFEASNDDLETIIDAVQRRRGALTERAVVRFSVGDRVEFEGRRGRTVVGTVTKINRKTVIVQPVEADDPDGGGHVRSWRVSGHLLKAVAS